MKQLSRYVFFLNIKGIHFIYNILNGKGLALHARIFELLNQYANNFDGLVKIHPTLYQSLVDDNYIIEEQTHEVEEVIKQFENQNRDPQSFNIIVNPTLDCNLRCWYCYENHKSGSMMSQRTFEALKNLIKNKVNDSRLKFLGVSFFGGKYKVASKVTTLYQAEVL